MINTSDKEEYDAKDKAYYSAALSAWFTTKLERDKQLLSLSVTAIGLLVTLLKIGGVSTIRQAVLFGIAIFLFLITAITIILIFDRNAIHIEQILSQSEDQDKILGILDKVSAFSFIFAVLFTLIIGIDSAIHSLHKPEITMNQDYSNRMKNYPAYHRGNDSVNGASKLRILQVPQALPNPPKEINRVTQVKIVEAVNYLRTQ